jgi:hypothetical protein
MENIDLTKYKIVIKPIKQKVKETDPVKLEAMKEKRKQQREERKKNPPKPKTEKKMKKIDDGLIKFNDKLNYLTGHTVEELNEKVHNLKGVQVGTQPNEIKIIKK